MRERRLKPLRQSDDAAFGVGDEGQSEIFAADFVDWGHRRAAQPLGLRYSFLDVVHFDIHGQLSWTPVPARLTGGIGARASWANGAGQARVPGGRSHVVAGLATGRVPQRPAEEIRVEALESRGVAASYLELNNHRFHHLSPSEDVPHV